MLQNIYDESFNIGEERNKNKGKDKRKEKDEELKNLILTLVDPKYRKDENFVSYAVTKAFNYCF